PLPDGPTMATNAPGSTLNVISFSTVRRRPPERYVFVSEAQRRMVLRIPRWGWIGLVVAALGGCDRDAAPPASPPPPAPDGGRGRVVFLGTSLTAGLGVDPSEAYPELLQRKIDSAGLRFVSVNAGVSGETSAGARRRIDWLLREPAAVLVIETGANDGLRGL